MTIRLTKIATRKARHLKKIVRAALRRRQKAMLEVSFERNSASLVRTIPHPRINYNTAIKSASLKRYLDSFLNQARDRELPFLKAVAGLGPNSLTLDFGCGLGRLASAYFDDEGSGHYIGWEPEPKALKFLKNAYAENARFDFGGVPLPKQLNYVTHSGSGNLNEKSSGAVATKLPTFMKSRQANLVVADSVFTHMWPRDCVENLKILKSVAAPGAVLVTTWFVVDDAVTESLKKGKADRKLPIVTEHGMLTYSKSNPLVCSAYPVNQVIEMYHEAGLPMPEIFYGSWSNSGRKNDYSYEDLVISKLPT